MQMQLGLSPAVLMLMSARRTQSLAWRHWVLRPQGTGEDISSPQRFLLARIHRGGRRALFLLGWLAVLGISVLGAGTASAQTTAPAQIAISLPDTSGVASETSTIPVEVGDLTGAEVFSFEFTLRYNADTLSVTGIETSGTIASELDAAVNTDSPGRVTVSAAATEVLSGRGTLVKLYVRCKGAGTSPLVWERFQFNEGSPRAHLSDGAVTVEPV